MTEYRIVDEYDRTTVFTGTELLTDTTDDGRKPRWVDITVWRTTAGQYVVMTETSYRVRHLSPTCKRADGYELAPSDEEDTAACPGCNPHGIMTRGWSQESRTTIEHYSNPASLIASFEPLNRFSRQILARISEVDPEVASLWMTVVVE